MKNIFGFLFALMIIISLAGCGGADESAATSNEQTVETTVEQPAVQETEQTAEKEENSALAVVKNSSMQESINGKHIDYENNDIVLIRDYQGKYIDKLQPFQINADYGNETYKVALFGDINDARIYYGEFESECSPLVEAGSISDSLITIINAPVPDGNKLVLYFCDSNNNYYWINLGTNKDDNLLIIHDSGKNNPLVDAGHTLKATYFKDGYTFYVEEDSSQMVQSASKNFLYMQYDGGNKVLLTESVDMGEEMSKSIRGIFNPMMSNDGSKVYYDTDAWTMTNGAGAGNHSTHVIDLKTFRDEFFSSGGLEYILTEYEEPYANYFIMKGYCNSANGVVPTYWLEDPDGNTVVNIGGYVDYYDLVWQINEALCVQNGDQYTDETSTYEEPEEEISLSEIIHGENITYDSYAAVVIEDYPEYGEYEFENYMEFRNPMYSSEPYYIYNIAVCGTITNVRLKTRPHMEEEFSIYDIADEISDAIVIIASRFPNDFSVDIISFVGPDGEFYEIPVEDMSDNKSIIRVYYPY